MCGDYAARSVLNGLAVDTTPRVRGLRKFDGVGCQHIRYNPACAGTTGTNKVNKRIGTIQPRVCGDYELAVSLLHAHDDTTPRVRGLRPCGLRQGCLVRYNPACAGTTMATASALPSMAIQPRVCGDYFGDVKYRSTLPDTTPRVRGLHRIDDAAEYNERYNPACAGTTRARRRAVMDCSIQPRVCGDYSFAVCDSCEIDDTPPRVRGLPTDLIALSFCERYNPACAGTTQNLVHVYGREQIQPRVCGDYWRT